MNGLNKSILFGLIGIIIGLFIYDRFLVPDTETSVEYRETIKTDTLWLPSIPELIFIRSPKPLYLRDTIINEVTYPLNSYSGLENTLYGQIKWDAETSGFLNKLNLRPEFKLPVVTTTLTKEKTSTIVIQPSGLFLVGGVNSNFSYSVGATYLKNKSLVGYEYQPQVNIHSLRVGFKVF